MAALDGLRGFAVAAVLLFHAGHLSGGFLGVDLFFVLSGFLITGLLLGEGGGRGRIALAAFWSRRARRLLPALVCVAVVTVVGTWAWGSADQLRFALDDLPWVGAQAVNWHYITEQIGYWNASDTRVFAHLWSIGVEWQFYLAWPLVVAVAARGRRGERIVAALAGAGALVSLVLTVELGAAVDTTRAYEGTDTRAAALLLGALVATAPVRNLARRVPRRAADLVCLALACGLAVAWAMTEGEKAPLLFQGGLFLHSVTAAVLIVLMAQVPGTRAARIAGSRLPRGLGQLSYSLYLWHWPVYLLLLPRLSTLGDRGATAVAIGVSVVAAAVTRRYVEDPVRFRAGWARGRRGLLAMTAVAVAGAVLWAAVPEPVSGAGTVDVDQLR
ncbi:putative peptidoglycan O-acetyltransferase YrhL [Streptomyces aurantiacus JA 4570]|uniref:Putative peptidoglycan O-acetyltransferase YrhL n=1 Tax=Streptomyces aurantiacus JA 4570 TaxID=1286094 RepID=S4AH40_9ACTN|nr:putative peptidoglycan O-acetyltransferase YrhL [Streptomyces aurantiacus JA 4570]